MIKFEDVERNGADSEQRDPAEDAQVDFRWRQGWGRKNHLQVENYLFSFFSMKKSEFLVKGKIRRCEFSNPRVLA